MDKVLKDSWSKYAKFPRTSSWSKQWWNTDCGSAKEEAMASGKREKWKKFAHVCKVAKCEYFDKKIIEMSESKTRIFDMMEWFGPRWNPVLEPLKDGDIPCNSREEEFKLLHTTFNAAGGRAIDPTAAGLDSIPLQEERRWHPF